MELMPELDEQVVVVARKRKACPNQCARHLAKQCKHECLRMVSAKVYAVYLHQVSYQAFKNWCYVLPGKHIRQSYFKIKE